MTDPAVASSFPPISGCNITKSIASGPVADVPLGTDIHWTILIVARNVEDYTFTDVVVRDIFDAFLEVGGGFAAGYAGAILPGYPTCRIGVQPPSAGGTVAIQPVGGSVDGATEVVWTLGTLVPRTVCQLALDISTDINPGGHQELTSPGIYTLNSGANIKVIDPSGAQQSAVSRPLLIETVP